MKDITDKKNIADVSLGQDVAIRDFVNLYGCTIGDRTKIGTFVEIQKGVNIGADCKISSHSFICEGVVIDDGVFIGHGVMFINDNHPRSINRQGDLESEADWKPRMSSTKICKHVSIGSNATILGGVCIGEGSIIGAGSVVVHDVEPYTIAVGNPAKSIKKVDSSY